MGDMERCPCCGSNRVRRSRTKTFMERLHRQFSMKRLHRCQACGWRGWGLETLKPAEPGDIRESGSPAPDLQAIDRALGAERAADPSSKS